MVFPSYILRTPIYPFNHFAGKFGNDTLTRENIKELFANPVFAESIFMASPPLYYEVEKWITGKLTHKKAEDRLVFSIVKYLLRMTTRPTPFGLFAGCNVGSFSNKSEVTLSPVEHFGRHTRLDMNFLCALSKDVSHHPGIRKKLNYFPNNSLYPVGNKYRYVEYFYENTKRIHRIVSIDKTEYIDKVLEKCRHGATYSDLTESIEDAEISYEDASAFIDELIHNQVVTSEIEPSTTGVEQMDHILGILEKTGETHEITGQLKTVAGLITDLDHNGSGNAIRKYEEIVNVIKEIGTSFDLKFLFQTDLMIGTDNNTISTTVQEELKRVIPLLQKLNHKQTQGNLEKFIKAFHERYEEREVPLAEALDTELGIGYALRDATAGDINPLVDDLRIPDRKEMQEYDIQWDALQSFWVKKLVESIDKRLTEVIITDEEIDKIIPEDREAIKPAATFSMMIQVVESDGVNDRCRILLKSIGGSTGASLLGRFCHGDPEILALVNDVTRREDVMAGDAIIAEIVHLPESRTGNVLLRPAFRRYEIPYLARGSVDSAFQLTLDDLFLTVRKDQIVIRSKSLNKVILPMHSRFITFFAISNFRE